MKNEIQTDSQHILWLDPIHKILSFRWEAGFEEMIFPSHEEKLTFAYQKGMSGYRIQ